MALRLEPETTTALLPGAYAVVCDENTRRPYPREIPRVIYTQVQCFRAARRGKCFGESYYITGGHHVEMSSIRIARAVIRRGVCHCYLAQRVRLVEKAEL